MRYAVLPLLVLMLAAIPPGLASGASSAPTLLDRACIVRFPEGVADLTAAAADDVPADIPLAAGPPLSPVASWYGLAQPFSGLRFRVDVPGVGGSVQWRYFDGSVAQPLTVVDATNNFANTGTADVTFTPPADWAPGLIQANPQSNCPGSLYWIKTTTQTSYVATPQAGRIQALV